MSDLPRQAQTFVYGQFILIVLVLVGTGSLPQVNLLGASLLAVGLLLGAWSLVVNRPDNFNLNPTPRTGASLCFDGPYKFMLHPMYMAQIIALAGILLMNFSWLSLAAWVGLLIVLEKKSSLEERLLKERSGDYERYSMKTKRFLPFIF